jgi:hypothetical protein
MGMRKFVPGLQYSLFGLFIAAGASLPGTVTADSAANKGSPSHHHHPQPSPQYHDRTGEFVKIVRDVTRRYRDPAVAVADGYVEQFGCVSGSHEGAMGVHLVNFPLVADGVLDPTKPELLVYEPQPNGELKLVAADYLIFSADWHKNNPAPPELLGQLFHLFEAPNRFGLDMFYTLHVWAWRENPQGTFANWNPNVSCDHFNDDAS